VDKEVMAISRGVTEVQVEAFRLGRLAAFRLERRQAIIQLHVGIAKAGRQPIGRTMIAWGKQRGFSTAHYIIFASATTVPIRTKRP
jgi:hypothetical protein